MALNCADLLWPLLPPPPPAVWVLCFILPLRSRQSAACLQPPNFVRMGVMYSATLPRLHLRAANFLSPGYSNAALVCCIRLLPEAPPPIPWSQCLFIEQTIFRMNLIIFVIYCFAGAKNLIILTAGSLHTFFILNENPLNSRHSVTELKGFFWMRSSVTVTTVFHGEVPAQRAQQHGEDSNGV